MGALFSRFRSKPSTRDVLEDIDKKLKSIDEFQQDTMERQKRVARRLLVMSILVYIVAILVFIFITSVQKFKLYYFTGLVAFAVVSWLSHKGLKWYYNRQMVSNSEKSVELRKKKKKILEDVMDTETYKVAKEILDKFGEKPHPTVQEIRATPANLMRQPQRAPGTELRQRQVEPKPSLPARGNNPINQPPATPINQGFPMKLPQQQMLSTQRPVAMNYGNPPSRPLPRPILPRERGVLDRMMDFFVGDGPHQRYALICRQCGGHNGMALQEEFEYVSYNCCYCYQFNPPRKMRPMGPRLPVPPPPTPSAVTSPKPKTAEDVKEEAASNVSTNVDQPPRTKAADSKSESSSEGDPAESRSAEDEGGEESSSSESEQVGEKMDVDTPEEENAISDTSTANEQISSLR